MVFHGSAPHSPQQAVPREQCPGFPAWLLWELPLSGHMPKEVGCQTTEYLFSYHLNQAKPPNQRFMLTSSLIISVLQAILVGCFGWGLGSKGSKQNNNIFPPFSTLNLNTSVPFPRGNSCPIYSNLAVQIILQSQASRLLQDFCCSFCQIRSLDASQNVHRYSCLHWHRKHLLKMSSDSWPIFNVQSLFSSLDSCQKGVCLWREKYNNA